MLAEHRFSSSALSCLNSLFQTSHKAKAHMTKSMTSLWLKSLRLVGKAQQARSRKLFKSMLAPASRTPVVKQAGVAKLRKTAQTIRTSAANSASTQVSAAKTLKPYSKAAAISTRSAIGGEVGVRSSLGTWKKLFFSLPAAGFAPARRMMYWLYLPAGTPQAPRPLVVMLHGCKQTATDFSASTRMNQLAERKGFAVLYPQQSAAGDANRCWHWFRRATQQGHGDVELIAKMVSQVRVQHGLDASRTYVAGLSAGGGLAAILALRHPHIFAAAGFHSAPVYGTSDSPMSGFQAMQQGSSVNHRDAVHEFADASARFPGMPVILIQGKSDPVVRRVNLDQLAAQFLLVNAPFIRSAEPVVRSHAGRLKGRSPRHAYKTATYRSGRKPMLMKCEIDSLGHAWSGGEARLKYSAPEGPDATLLIWTFFSQQRRIKSTTAAL